MARALAGSLGVLGVIVEVSLKVLPRPATETTLRFEMDEIAALAQLSAMGGRPLPVSASAWCAGMLALRLSGAPDAITDARRRLGGEEIDGSSFWTGIREQQHPFFTGEAPLWRLSLPSTAAPIGLGETQLIEWGGALRWLRSPRAAAEIRTRVQQLGGHATLFRGGDRSQGVFTPLAPALAAIQRRLKAEFDPAGIFNAGRMYPEF